MKFLALELETVNSAGECVQSVTVVCYGFGVDFVQAESACYTSEGVGKVAILDGDGLDAGCSGGLELRCAGTDAGDLAVGDGDVDGSAVGLDLVVEENLGNASEKCAGDVGRFLNDLGEGSIRLNRTL